MDKVHLSVLFLSVGIYIAHVLHVRLHGSAEMLGGRLLLYVFARCPVSVV